MQKEIVDEGPLLSSNGHIRCKGYSKKHLLEYDRKSIKVSPLKIKEWDYYLVSNSKYGVALTIADNGYMGLLSASFIDFSKKTQTTKSLMNFLPLGKMKLPSSSKKGDVVFSNKRIRLEFLHETGGRYLHFVMTKFDGKNDFEARLKLTDEPKESMNIATPFTNKPKYFYYNQKIVGFRVSGSARIGDKKISFSPKSTFGLLDWGRGVWPYKNTWFWSAGCAEIEGKLFAFNLGYGFGDTKYATENMIFYEGMANKIEGIRFDIPKKNNGKEDYLRPWTISSTDERFEMKFYPQLNRSSKSSIGIISSDQNQVFGKFSGYAILDNGKKIFVENMNGFAEKVINKW